MAIYKNCQPIPCNDDTSIREWIEANPPPIGGVMTQQLDWLVGYLRAYACACGCGEEQLQTTLQQLVNFFQNLRCPDNPLPVQDCLSEQILQQLQAINENTDELEITAQNINLNAEQINLNTDDVEALLQNILNRLNEDCSNPLATQVCNPADISSPIVDAISTINLNIPPRPVLDCNLNPTGDEAPGVTVTGVVQNRPCPAEDYALDQVDLGATQTATIPPNVKSYTVTVLQGTGSVNGVGNLPQGFSMKGGGYSDGSRTVAPIQIAAGPASRVVAFWEF